MTYRWKCEEWNPRRERWEEMALYHDGTTERGVSREMLARRLVDEANATGQKARLIDLTAAKVPNAGIHRAAEGRPVE